MKRPAVLLALSLMAAPLAAVTIENQYIRITVDDFNQRIDYFGTTGGVPGLASDDNKPLLHAKDPSMNSVSLFLDGNLYKIGVAGKPVRKPGIEAPNLITAQWQIEKILFTQNIEIVNGPSSLLPDTVKITYVIQNLDAVPHEIGVKLVFDTFNGANDNIPFLVPLIGVVANERKVTNTGTGFKIPEFFSVIDSAGAPQTVFQATLRDKGLASPDDIVFASPDTLNSTGWKPAVEKKPMKSQGGLPDTGYALFWGPIRFPGGPDKRSVKRLSTEIGVYSPSRMTGDILDISMGAPEIVTMKTFTVAALIQNSDKFKCVKDVQVELLLPDGCQLVTKKVGAVYTIPEMKPDDTRFLYYVVDSQGMAGGESTITFRVKGDVNGSIALSSVRRRIRK